MCNVQKDENAESRVVMKGNRGFALRLHKLPGLTNVSSYLAFMQNFAMHAWYNQYRWTHLCMR